MCCKCPLECHIAWHTSTQLHGCLQAQQPNSGVGQLTQHATAWHGFQLFIYKQHMSYWPRFLQAYCHSQSGSLHINKMPRTLAEGLHHTHCRHCVDGQHHHRTASLQSSLTHCWHHPGLTSIQTVACLAAVDHILHRQKGRWPGTAPHDVDAVGQG